MSNGDMFDKDLRDAVVRRWDHLVRSIGSDDRRWQPAGFGARLAELRTVNELRLWTQSLPPAIRRSPFGEYCIAHCECRGAPALFRMLGRHLTSDRSALENLGLAHVTESAWILDAEARALVTDWAHEAQVAWAPWAPQLDTGRFELVYSGRWPEATEAPIAKVAVETLLTGSADEYAVALWEYESMAALIESATLRDRWADILLCNPNSDCVLLPLLPGSAAWVISYFHHDYLEAGKLQGRWPLRVELEGALPR